VTTSARGRESAIAIAEAAVVEVPLAAAAFWLAAKLAASDPSQP
jgi:2-keto-4-pentenoate hydratase